MGNDTFLPEVQHCPLGRTCKDGTGICESDGNYECSEVDKFQCEALGVFPSPFNCRDYFICAPGPDDTFLKYNAKCDPTHEFDPASRLCRRKVENVNRCHSPIPVCHNETQTGAIKSNLNIFYNCKKDNVAVGLNFVPQLHACPYNFRFNGTRCVDPKPDVLDKFGYCLVQGKFSHPTDCTLYNYCVYVGESPQLQTCSQSQKWDQLEGKCVSFSCDTYNE